MTFFITDFTRFCSMFIQEHNSSSKGALVYFILFGFLVIDGELLHLMKLAMFQKFFFFKHM